jgi:hypothetical protein
MAHDVFVSYSNKDKPVADAVVAELENSGIRCWVAPRDITPGSSWGQAIINAIEASRFMVIILSGNSNRSKQVVREVERAVANDVIIIPFRIENIDPTGAMAYFLSSEHWLDAITPPLEEHIKKLANTIQLFQSEGGEPKMRESIVKPAFYSSRPPRQWLLVWVLLALFSILAMVILAIFLVPKLTDRTLPSMHSTPANTSSPTEIPSTPTSTAAPAFSEIGVYRTSGSTNGLFITNNILYLANGTNGLEKLSVADPTAPKPISEYQVGDAQELVVVDNIAYIITGNNTKRQLVIAQLGGEGLSTTFPGEGEGLGAVQSLYNITVVNELAHLTGHNYWGILNVTDPMNPQLLWTWEPPSHSGMSCNAFVDGNLAYIGCGWAGFFIFDITDPQTPQQLGSYETPNWVVNITVQEQVAYLTLGESGLLALDVSDPSKPMLIDRINLAGFASHLSISGDFAYITYTKIENNVLVESGVIAVNVSDPEAMSVVATYDELYMATDIQTVGGAVFVADELYGLIVLSLGISE